MKGNEDGGTKAGWDNRELVTTAKPCTHWLKGTASPTATLLFQRGPIPVLRMHDANTKPDI